jgi:hypothetical protein
MLRKEIALAFQLGKTVGHERIESGGGAPRQTKKRSRLATLERDGDDGVVRRR